MRNISIQGKTLFWRSIGILQVLSICLSLILLPRGSVAHAAGDTQTNILEDVAAPASVRSTLAGESCTVLVGLGDSLTHGTMDATNNDINSLHAYLQKVADSLGQEINLLFTQPLFDEHEERLQPFRVPTNLGVDGSDTFSLVGLEYHKRVGADKPFINEEYFADKLLPAQLDNKYDKVLYPINLLAGRPTSQLSSALWWLDTLESTARAHKALTILWIGNNDSSLAALGAGGSNPEYQPLPFDVIKSELKPSLRLLLRFGELTGEVSFEPYTQSAIERNLTELGHFVWLYDWIVSRLEPETGLSAVANDLFLLTLPYYSAVGYLMDSEDLEFYLQKLNPAYTVPPTFKRVAPPGEPITNPLKGDRISLLTFGLMYAFLGTGHSIDEANQILEIDGQQRDGMVLSEEEQQFIMNRIDGFNDAIKAAAASHGPHVHLVDIGGYLNMALTGDIEIVIDGHVLSRKWIRGSGFSLDGVHPGYTGQALVANFVLQQINEALGLNASLYDLAEILNEDPYVDQDGDGWAPGPNYFASGATKLLFLFKDPDDTNAGVQVELPADVWDIISDVLLDEILHIPAIRAEAERLGIVSPQ